MLKTKKQIAETVIKDYESFITKNKKSGFKRFRDFLNRKNADCGICLYLNINYNTSVSTREYVKKNAKYDETGATEGNFVHYWWKIPFCAEDKKEIIECLQKRIDILKTWL